MKYCKIGLRIKHGGLLRGVPDGVDRVNGVRGVDGGDLNTIPEEGRLQPA